MNTPETALSFAYADEPQAEVVDRSTLEQFACCPAQARFIQTGAVLTETFPALVGSAVHEAFGIAISEYACRGMEASAAELADIFRSQLRSSRPDIQPQAIKAGSPSAWAWARYITSINPSNILRWDGGPFERSGQLANDLPIGDLTLRITSELDLLVATPAPVVLREVDYKSGWRHYGPDDIAESFQFGLHAWLVFHNYPDIQALEVCVWHTRTNSLSYAVTFDRDKHLQQIDTRIRAAAGEYVLYRNSKPQDAPVWPAVEKCGICQAAVYCPAALHAGDFAGHPAIWIERMVAVEAQLNAMREAAAAHVDATGKDLVLDGLAFGRNKPASEKKRPAVLYQLKGET